MALATTNETRPAPVMTPTPGVGMQGPAPTTTDQPPAAPMLPEDIDPVLLVRLYPEVVNTAEARAMAMAAGEATAAAGEELIASQNELIFFEGDGIPPEERDRRRAEALAALRAGAPRPAAPRPTPPRATQQPAPQPPHRATHELNHKADDKRDEKK